MTEPRLAQSMRPGGRDPLWTRAPFLLLRFPRVLVSVWVGAALLAFAAAAYPLMLSARTTRLLHDRIADPAVTRFGAGITYAASVSGLPLGVSVLGGPSSAAVGRAFAERTADRSLGSVVETELGPTLSLAVGRRTTDARLFAGDGAFGHATVLRGPDGGGVWVSDLAARALGVGVGDRMTILGRGDRAAAVRVAAIYRARVGEPRTGYWQVWDQEIYPKCTNECPVPPPFVLVAPGTMSDLTERLGLVGVSRAWQAPVDGSPTLEDARRIAALADSMQSEAGRPGTVLACCRPFATDAGAIVTPRLASAMPAVVRRANGEVAGIGGPGRLLQVTALVVALVVVGAAAASGHAARRTELRLLFSRGATTASVGGRAAVEAVLPAVAGGVTGLLAGLAVVPLFGAGARASGGATTSAALGAVVATIASVLVVGVVSAVAFARHGETARGGMRIASRLPFELGIAALAVIALSRLRSGGAFVEQSATGIRVPSLAVLFFPVLTLAAATGLVARVAVAAAGAARRRTERSPAPLFLAVRRVAADAGSSALFVAAAGLCLGIFILAQTIVGSLRDTVDAKAKLFVGSDVQAIVGYDAPVVRSFPLPITRVTRVPDGATTVPDGAQVDLLAVDTRTLADAAFWRDGLSTESIDDIATMLAEPTGGALPVVAAGRDDAFTSLDVSGTDVPVRVVATASAFPGVTSGQPLVVVSADALTARLAGLPNVLRSAGATTQLWVRGPTAAAVGALRRLPFTPDTIVTADEVADIPHVAIVLGMFSLLQVLGSLAALLVVASVLLYLQSRQRAQLVSYGLSLRMGLADREQRRSIIVEVAVALAVALIAGVAVAVGVALVLLPLLDPIPSIAPEPFLDLPVLPIAAILAGVAASAWVAARSTNRTARSADLGQVMRGVD
jgi:putative ABC transport system permease protein